MKKIVLWVTAVLAASATSLSAAQQFYVDDKGQVFTTSAPDRVALENKESPMFSKAMKLEFSGTHYFGYTAARPADSQITNNYGNSSGFELRRNYVQVKGFFNDKDYWRVTMDATKELSNDSAEDTDEGYADVFVKYAYLYLNNILPSTSVEFGIAHRPWIDYEEHNGWYYRSFNKVVLEEKNTATEAGVDLVNSSDLGINFKTKTDIFSSEIGIYNGEGYHADKDAANQENDSKLSVEWRLTGHLIGSGKKVGKNNRLKDTYAHLSTYGLVSHNHKDNDPVIGDSGEYDRSFYGVHAVYNQPEFLLAAQYFTAEDDKRTAGVTDAEYAGLSINGEIRPFKDWTIIGRYDDYEKENKPVSGATTINYKGDKLIAGLAYKYNKNVSFIASAKFIDEVDANRDDTSAAKDVYMLTTEVKW
ncbi:MAG: hypothetical protein WC390_01115 [Sulfurimonas sp.]